MAGLIYEFTEILKQEHEQYLKLIEIGRLKRTHIIKGNLQEMNSANTIEEHLAAKIKALEKKRIEYMNDMSMILNLNKDTVTVSQIQEALENQPEEASALNDAKVKLKAVLAELKIVNDENIMLINQSLEYANYSINVLQSSLVTEPETADYGNTQEKKGGSFFDAKQ